MANYYVNPTNGNDTNTGLSVAQAYATAQKAATMVAQADKVFLAVGEYKEMLQLQTDGATGANRITWIGDTTGEIFGTDPGIVIFTASNALGQADDRNYALDLNGKDFNTFDNIEFVGGLLGCIYSGGAVADSNTFTRCEAMPGFTFKAIFIATAVGQFTNLVYENGYAEVFMAASFGGLCNITGGVALATSGNNAIFRNNYFLGAGSPSNINGYFFGSTASNNYTTFTNNIVHLFTSIAQSATYDAFSGAGTGAVCANNIFITHGSAGYNDTYVGAFATMSGNIYGRAYRKNLHPALFQPIGTITPLDGASTTATYAASDDANVTHVRLAGVESVARPQHGGTDIGAFEWNPPPKKETTTVDEGSTAMRLDRACVKEFYVPVNDSGTITVSFRMRKNSTYSGTQPKMELSGEGLTTTSASMSVGADTWETVTISTVSTSIKGLAVLRFYSYSTVNGSSVYVDNGSITRA